MRSSWRRWCAPGRSHRGSWSSSRCERIEELNPALNAFVEVDDEGALATADAIGAGDERPFAGVPVAVKNNRPVKGMRLTYGCRLMEAYVADYDHNVTSRLRDAGFVIVGTTTLPEYGILPVSEARIFGPTRNPWDLERTPGGSSGGAAAAVAAGHGPCRTRQRRRRLDPDTRRMLRPRRPEAEPRAHLGRLPSSGTPRWGSTGCSPERSPTRPRSSTCSPATSPATPRGRRPPRGRSRRLRRAEPGRMRIAFSKQTPSPDATLDPIAARGADEAAELLRSLGHEVVEADPPWRQDGLSELFGVVFSSQIALSIGYSANVSGKGIEGVSAEDMEPMSWAIFSMIRKLGTLEQQSAVVRLQAFARRLVAWLDEYDALLTPALAERPLPLGTLDTAAEDPMSTFTRSGLFTPFTPVFNATGQPGISLPLYEGEDGLPLARAGHRQARGRGAAARAGRPARSGTALGRAARAGRRVGLLAARSPGRELSEA